MTTPDRALLREALALLRQVHPNATGNGARLRPATDTGDTLHAGEWREQRDALIHRALDAMLAEQGGPTVAFSTYTQQPQGEDR